EALELVKRVVGVGALPERIEEHRAEALERRAEPARVRHERTPLEDEREVVARTLGVDEAGRAERHDAGQSEALAGGPDALGEEGAKRAVHGGGDPPVARPERARRLRWRPGDANASGEPAELDVRRRVALRPERPVDLRLHRADRRDDPRVDARPVHDVARLGHEARPHAEVAGCDARLDERLTLPELGAVPVVGAVPREREDDGARSPLRPEAQVHAEGVALVGDPLEEGHDLAADTREVLAVL